jgi:nanoRNase/pAp phosphatase (c-di-AMP/oligoRNAs hydrolase)
MDEWVTYTFNLDSPTSGAGSYTPFTNDKLDFFAISLGGGGHENAGVFYIRNFIFN